MPPRRVRQPNCRWYSGSGIYRHTWLLATNSLHVAYWGTFVTAPRVSKTAATLQVKTRVKNERKTPATCLLTTTLLDRDGKTVQTSEATQQIAAAGEYEFVQKIRVVQPKRLDCWKATSFSLPSRKLGKTGAQ